MKSNSRIDMDLVVKAKRSLLLYTAVLLVSCSGLQIFIASRNSSIDSASQLLLGVIAVYYYWYSFMAKNDLNRIRFGRLVAHLVTYVIVNVSFHLHAFILLAGNNTVIRGDDSLAINSGWYGALFGMATFWGLGLLIHAVVSIYNRGFEERE